jgi:methylmalonyl-CoA mutase
MTMNGAVLPVLALYIVAAEEQGVPGEARRDHPERHPQGVHGPQHLHLPAVALDADHLGHLRLHVGARCRSSTRSRSPATTCRRPARRPTSSWPTRSPTASSTCAPGSSRASTSTQVRAAPVVLLGDRHELLHGGRQAARGPLLWAKLIEEFAAQEPQVAGAAHALPDLRLELTAQDVYNNVVRTCIEAMAATQGHTQSLHTNALDEALALPTDFSARIARNTQLFLQQEPAPPARRRPVGRQLLRRALTHDLAQARWEHIRRSRSSAAWPRPSSRHPQAAHRGGRRAHAGAHRQRRADHRRRQQVQARRSPSTSTSSRSTTGGARAAARARTAARRTRDAGGRAALDALTRGARTLARATCWRSPSTPRAPRPRSARSATRSRRSSAVTRPRARRSPGVYSGERQAMSVNWSASKPMVEPSPSRRPPAAHPRRQDGPGRPRPRPEGDRHRVRRPRLRRRHRPAVPDPRGSRAQAVENDVHIVGVSSLAAGHLTLVPAAASTS